ncbi:MAG: class I SAM-dependent methyltransferase [Bdellovibrionales bacterium]|nr:class I SAM-dependent methyltransferase [Bdellovibrionales bacterium]
MRHKLEQREEIVFRDIALMNPPAQGSVLDLGCGDGCFLSHWSKAYPQWRCFGVDGSSAQLKKARERLPQSQFEQVNFAKPLPFGDASFDFVTSGEVIEHLLDPDLFLKEAFRVLKPGGRVIISTPNLMAWYNRLLILFGCSPIFVEYSTVDASVGYGPLKRLKADTMPVGHLRIYHPAALKDSMTLAGFVEPKLKGARFEGTPGPLFWLDNLISYVWSGGSSLLIVFARKTT